MYAYDKIASQELGDTGARARHYPGHEYLNVLDLLPYDCVAALRSVIQLLSLRLIHIL